MSSSKSNTSQATWQQDNRRVIGQGGASAEGGSTITINALDGQALNNSLLFANEALGLVGRTNQAAFDFGNESVMGALGFGGKALVAALDASSDALAFADQNSARQTTAAYNFATDALGGAMSFGSSALNKASNAFEVSTGLVKDAYADAKGRGALTDKILIGAIVAMAVVAYASVKK